MNFFCVLFLDSEWDITNNGKVAREKRGWMIYKLILMVLLWITRKEIFFPTKKNLQLFTHVNEHSTFHPPTASSMYDEALCVIVELKLVMFLISFAITICYCWWFTIFLQEKKVLPRNYFLPFNLSLMTNFSLFRLKIVGRRHSIESSRKIVC